MERLVFTVEREEEGARLDRFICEKLPDRSRSQMQKLIEDGAVLVNGKAVKSGYRLREADRVEAGIPEARALTETRPEKMELAVVYEDPDLAIINKPQGMVVHPAAGHEDGTLVNGLLYHFEGKLSGINGVLRPGIVHRIDKDTSGLLVICKSDAAHKALGELMERHAITRRYHAIVHGNLLQDTGTVNAPIGRSPKDRKKMAIVPDGRPAVTHYRVLERFGAFTYIELTLETGRTHQIRVHMKSLQHPVLGDPLYGPKRIQGEEKRLLAGVPEEALLGGQLLHAKTLGFVHPIRGEYMEWDSELPEHFLQVLTRLRESV